MRNFAVREFRTAIGIGTLQCDQLIEREVLGTRNRCRGVCRGGEGKFSQTQPDDPRTSTHVYLLTEGDHTDRR